MSNLKIIPDASRGEVQDVATPEQLAIIEKNNREVLAGFPTPLPDRLEVDFFDISLLPDALMPWVEDVAKRFSCPIEYAAVGALIAASAAVGSSVAVLPKRNDTWHEYANLWGIIVGSPSSMKSTPLSEMLRPLKKVEDRLKESFQVADDLWQKEAKIIDAKNSAIRDAQKKLTKDAIKDGADIADLELPEELELPARPFQPRYVAKDITPERLEIELVNNTRGIMVYHDELQKLFSTFCRSGHEGARSLYLSGWSGHDWLDTLRMTRADVSAEKYSLGVVGTIQPGPLSSFVSDAGTKNDDGFMQRFGLMVWPDDSYGFKSIDTAPDEAARIKYVNCIERLAMINLKGGQSVGIEIQGVRGPALRFDDQAAQAFKTWMEDHMNALKRSDEGEALIAHLSKYRKLVPALALIDHVCNLDRFGSTGSIDKSSVERAILLADILSSHARKVYNDETSPVVEKANRLLKAARKITGKTRVWTVRDICRANRKGMKTKEDVIPVIKLLMEYGHVYGPAHFPKVLKSGRYSFHSWYN
jgi:putative DNA primase/helicase